MDPIYIGSTIERRLTVPSNYIGTLILQVLVQVSVMLSYFLSFCYFLLCYTYRVRVISVVLRVHVFTKRSSYF